jgi:hypothetical protein
VTSLPNSYSQIGLATPDVLGTPKPKLSEVDPFKSLGSVTAPLDGLWQGIGSNINMDSLRTVKEFIDGKISIGGLKSLLDESLASKSISDASGTGSKSLSDYTVQDILGVAKRVVILIADILIVVLDILSKALRGFLGLIT